MADKKTDFEVLRTNPVIRLGNTNYFISVQKVVSDSGNTSDHFVIKKQGVNDDGSLRGQTRQLFIPIGDAKDLLESCVAFLSD